MWRQITPDDIRGALSMFEEREFFYGTKRPDTLSEAKVEALLTDQRWNQYVCGDGDALAGVMAEDRENVSAEIRFRAAGDSSPERRLAMLATFIDHVFGTLNYDKLHAHVFSFDSNGQEDYAAAGMQVQAVLKDHVNKSARYCDVLIYGLESRQGEE